VSAPVHDDTRTARGEFLCIRTAEAATRARHERDLVVEADRLHLWRRILPWMGHAALSESRAILV
jgi:hypothetical protein